MSVKFVYSVFDSKADAYLQPFFAPTRGVAVRMFETAAQDVAHDFHRHAGDFTLFEIGEFDEVKGTLVPYEVKYNCGAAIQYLAKAMPVDPGEAASRE